MDPAHCGGARIHRHARGARVDGRAACSSDDPERERVSQLDEVEADALDYLVAFDLKKFDIAFSMGTEHPRVAWSSRASDEVRDPALPGPDGIGDVAPLVRIGLVPPWAAERVSVIAARLYDLRYRFPCARACSHPAESFRP
jgi:hypothetical protein